jgi:DNA-binding HxlR family transcriptional regulator
MSPTSRPDLFDRKYTVRVLAEMEAETGTRAAALAHRTGASRAALRETLQDLTQRRWIRRNPGYGHPLRPEFLLTARGHRVAGHCADLNRRLARVGAQGVLERKWALPVLHRIGTEPRRFSELTAGIAEITDRALSQALTDLIDHGLVLREIRDGRPPGTAYSATAPGRRLLPALDCLLER